LDVAIPQADGLHVFQFANDTAGFGALVQGLPKDACCVMEATGPYHCALAVHLHGQQVALSVINPLQARHFARMRMKRAKTDRADCQLLAQYGQSEQPATWAPQPGYLTRMRQEMAVLEQLEKDKRGLLNQRKSLSIVPNGSPKAVQVIEDQLKNLGDAIAELEKSLQKTMQDNNPGMFDRLQTIPGIGPKTAMALIVITNGFANFQNYKQLIAYVGLAPRHHQSGTSVRGATSICKMGM
jgi:transposase